MTCRYDTAQGESVMQTATSRAIYEHWAQVRGGRDIPNRRDIEPGALRRFLPDLFILEMQANAVVAFRLAGTRLCTLFGRELRATEFTGLFPSDMRSRLTRICSNVMAQRTPAIMRANAYGSSVQAVPVEIALLPMTSHSSRADRLFGAFCPVGTVQPLDVPLRHVVLEMVEAIPRTIDGAPLAAPAPADTPTSIVAVSRHDVGRAMRRVLHLRIFDGGGGR